MTIPHIVRRAPIGEGARSGAAAPAGARWLGLAAAPTFAIMALWTALSSAPSGMPDMEMRGSSALSGMTLMYLMMSVFHLSPWLTLIAGLGNGACRRTGSNPEIQANSSRS
ncbi:MAG: hypothetical protein M0Z84_08225 [Gammaproteobacteria bacterium]|nr:hypothetical protein [Gammaproteobacteria bacterium]